MTKTVLLAQFVCPDNNQKKEILLLYCDLHLHAESSIFQLKNKLCHTDEGESLLVEHSAGQQVEVVLHRVHNHCVTCIVSSLQTVQKHWTFQQAVS